MSMTTELIERLRQHADTFEKSGFAVDGLVKDYREAADTIQLLSEKLHASQMERSSQYYNDGWIPVSERLPEDGRPVLIYAWNVHHVVARYDSFRTENGYKKCWVTADAWNGNMEIKYEVIAWMPLPQPYKVESEDKV